jgi:hypothetical protein
MATAIKTWVLVFGIYGHGPPSVVPDYGTQPECEQARDMLLRTVKPSIYALCIPGPVKVN